ncbi:hypothetical protein HK101_010442 [Irineochytrium annulatum]|nr:hypothetical protein HK101_010442 [Irineochytrium annulatum]
MQDLVASPTDLNPPSLPSPAEPLLVSSSAEFPQPPARQHASLFGTPVQAQGLNLAGLGKEAGRRPSSFSFESRPTVLNRVTTREKDVEPETWVHPTASANPMAPQDLQPIRSLRSVVSADYIKPSIPLTTSASHGPSTVTFSPSLLPDPTNPAAAQAKQKKKRSSMNPFSRQRSSSSLVPPVVPHPQQVAQQQLIADLTARLDAAARDRAAMERAWAAEREQWGKASESWEKERVNDRERRGITEQLLIKARLEGEESRKRCKLLEEELEVLMGDLDAVGGGGTAAERKKRVGEIRDHARQSVRLAYLESRVVELEDANAALLRSQNPDAKPTAPVFKATISSASISTASTATLPDDDFTPAPTTPVPSGVPMPPPRRSPPRDDDSALTSARSANVALARSADALAARVKELEAQVAGLTTVGSEGMAGRELVPETNELAKAAVERGDAAIADLDAMKAKADGAAAEVEAMKGRVVEIQATHQAEMASLQAEHARMVSDLQAKLHEALTRAEGHGSDAAALRATVAEIRAEQASAVDTASAEADAVRAELEGVIAKLKTEMEAMKVSHATALQKARAEVDGAGAEAAMTRFLLEEARSKHASEISDAKALHEREVKTLGETLGREVASLTDAHAAAKAAVDAGAIEMDNLRAEHLRANVKARMTAEASVAAAVAEAAAVRFQMEAEREKHVREMEEVKAGNKKEVEMLSEVKDAGSLEIDSLRAEHARALEKMRLAAEESVAVARAEAAAVRLQLEQSTARAIEESRVAHAREVMDVLATREREVAELKAEAESRKAEVESLRTALAMEVAPTEGTKGDGDSTRARLEEVERELAAVKAELAASQLALETSSVAPASPVEVKDHRYLQRRVVELTEDLEAARTSAAKLAEAAERRAAIAHAAELAEALSKERERHEALMAEERDRAVEHRRLEIGWAREEMQRELEEEREAHREDLRRVKEELAVSNGDAAMKEVEVVAKDTGRDEELNGLIGKNMELVQRVADLEAELSRSRRTSSLVPTSAPASVKSTWF